MNIRGLSGCAVLMLVFASGCAGNREFQRVETMRRESGWPKIRAAAEKEIARRDGDTKWSSQAYYEPKQHAEGVWTVVAFAAYPGNKYGDSIDLQIRDNGKVISYAPRLPDLHPRKKALERSASKPD